MATAKEKNEEDRANEGIERELVTTSSGARSFFLGKAIQIY
jgi:hypothetical protein